MPDARRQPSGAGPMKQARLASNCAQCGSTVEPGDDIYPVAQPPGRRTRAGLEWLHLACASELGGGSPPELPVCKHWARGGSCQYGEKCFFPHPPEVGAAVLESLRARKADPNRKVANRGDGKRNRVKNDGRASVMRRWLLETFGPDHLRSGQGVLDVAGGKGELAWELLNLNGVPASVVEPRPLDFASCEGKFRYGIYWRNPIWHDSLHCPHDPEAETRAPEHLRLLLEPRVVSWALAAPEATAGGGADAGAESAFEASCRAALALRWTRKGLHEEEEEEEEPAEGREAEEVGAEGADEDVRHEAGDGAPVASAERALELLRACSTVVALHPDQAAEHAMRLALALGKPFAVVPCCVYSVQFPRRRLPCGAPVRTYEELLRYLQGLSPRVRREELDFEGKCVVLYMTAADVADAACGATPAVEPCCEPCGPE